MIYPIEFASLGPGDAELITLQVLHALQQADVIFYPATQHQSRAALLLKALKVSTPTQPFVLPMNNDRAAVKAVYDQLAQMAMAQQRAGKRVVVAVEGDAGIYASMHYVLELLQQMGCATRQLAGIPSFIAAGAVGQLHLVQQAERLVVLPGKFTNEELDQYLQTNHTVVIMKLSRSANQIRQYMATHKQYTFHYFQDVATPMQKYQQNELPEEVPYFAVMIVRG